MSKVPLAKDWDLYVTTPIFKHQITFHNLKIVYSRAVGIKRVLIDCSCLVSNIYNGWVPLVKGWMGVAYTSDAA